MSAARNDAEGAKAQMSVSTAVTDISSYYISNGNLPDKLNQATSVSLNENNEFVVDGTPCFKFEITKGEDPVKIPGGRGNEICKIAQGSPCTPSTVNLRQ